MKCSQCNSNFIKEEHFLDVQLNFGLFFIFLIFTKYLLIIILYMKKMKTRMQIKIYMNCYNLIFNKKNSKKITNSFVTLVIIIVN